MAKKNAFRQSERETVFSDVANEWLSVKSLSVKSSTYAVYKAALDRHILPALKNCKVNRLTAADISNFAKEKIANGRLDKKGGLSAKTVSDMLSMIKSILAYALETKKITQHINVPHPKHNCRAKRAFNMKEQSQLESNLIRDILVLAIFVIFTPVQHTIFRAENLTENAQITKSEPWYYKRRHLKLSKRQAAR